MPAPPNIDAAVELGVPKVDAVVELPPKTFLLALAAFGAAPRPLKKPPPLLPDDPKTLVVETAPEVAAPEVVPDEPNTLAVEAAVEVAEACCYSSDMVLKSISNNVCIFN